MSVFTGGPYGRLAVMLNTLSSLNIEIIIIIIIIIIILLHYFNMSMQYVAILKAVKMMIFRWKFSYFC